MTLNCWKVTNLIDPIITTNWVEINILTEWSQSLAVTTSSKVASNRHKLGKELTERDVTSVSQEWLYRPTLIDRDWLIHYLSDEHIKEINIESKN